MGFVLGVDFGTLNVRVSLFSSREGRIDSESVSYPLFRTKDDPRLATQSHADQMQALVKATRTLLGRTSLSGAEIEALAVDTTGSSVIMTDEALRPLSDYYLWCDTRATAEAEEITTAAKKHGLEAIQWCGGSYSPEWGFAKVLHWLRHAEPSQRERFGTALENCDMVAATLTGVSSVNHLKRSVCAMGHKWMWNAALGGLPPDSFFASIDPIAVGLVAKIKGEFLTSDHLYGHLTPECAELLGLKAGIPIPVGGLDAHWDALGAGCRIGDVVNVVGTSTCFIAIGPHATAIPGVSGVVQGSVHPAYAGIEAGIPAVGDMFDAIAKRCNQNLGKLSAEIQNYRAGQTGLIRIPWDNGDRAVLGTSHVSGVTVGWNLQHTAADELFAAIEGTAFQTRLIFERMGEYGARTERVINGGGIPQNNRALNQLYANVLNKDVLVPNGQPTSCGSAIFAMLAAKIFQSVEEAQEAICLPFTIYRPEPEAVTTYAQLYALYRKLYFALGDRPNSSLADVFAQLGEQRKVL